MIPITNITGRLGNQMFQTAYLVAQEMDGRIPDIYLQDEAYFERHKYSIRRLFGHGITPIDQVAIHVRRGTNPHNPAEPAYHDNPFYVNLVKDGYYERAMAEFPDEDFLIFSDDIEWCKKQPIFQGRRFSFSEGNDEVTDLNLMAGCKGIIMANSSFSWWGAYLGDPKKRVIAPIEWYADGLERTKLLKEWKRV